MTQARFYVILWILCISTSIRAQSVLLTHSQLDTVKQYTSLTEALQNPDDVYKLNLRYQSIETLPADIGKLKNLQILRLTGNGLVSLPTEIGNLTNLQELYMEDNRLTSLPASMGKLINLSKLQLMANQIKTLPIELTQLQNLDEIDLRDNAITEAEQKRLAGLLKNAFVYMDFVPVMLTKQELKQVTATKSMDEALKSPETVVVLDLSNQHLGSLSADIAKLTNLQMLLLWNNDLKSLPPEIAKLEYLQVLEAGDNALESLPVEMAGMRSLSVLDISGNKNLTKIPDCVWSIGHLKEFNAAKCMVSALNDSICNATNLEYLNLFGNILVTIPDTLAVLQSLSVLNLGGNNSLNLAQASSVVAKMPELAEFGLTEGRFINLPDEFCLLSHLKVLDLRLNPVSSSKMKRFEKCLPTTKVIY